MQVEDQRDKYTPAMPSSNHRILIHITDHPSTAMLIRRGRRVADYLGAPCFAVYVAKDANGSNLNKDQKKAVERHLGFARNLRVETEVLQGRNAAQKLVEFAREKKITRIFLGRHSRNTPEIVHSARDVDITVVAERQR